MERVKPDDPMAFDQERDLRYTVSIEAHIHQEMRRTVTQTRDLSKRGLFFFSMPAPSVGTRLLVTLHPENREAITIDCVVRHSLQNVGAGVELSKNEEAEDYLRFIDELAQTTQAWATIGEFVKTNQELPNPTLAVLQQKEMYEIGETCEAIRILFELHPAVLPDQLDALTRTALGTTSEMLEGVSTESMGIKLHMMDRLRKVRIGILKEGTDNFVAIIPPATVPGRPAVLYLLKGQELIMVAAGRKPCYPFFSVEHFNRISRDTVLTVLPKNGAVIPKEEPQLVPLEKRIPKTPTADLPPFPPGLIASPTLANWTRFTSKTHQILVELFETLRAEIRVYDIHGAQRAVRLLRDLTLLVRDRLGEQKAGSLFHDGDRLCVLFGLDGQDTMSVRPLTIEDEIKIPALAPEPA